MNNEIESIIADFEWWLDTLENDRMEGDLEEFGRFTFKYLPKVIDVFKQSQQEQTANMLGMIT